MLTDIATAFVEGRTSALWIWASMLAVLLLLTPGLATLRGQFIARYPKFSGMTEGILVYISLPVFISCLYALLRDQAYYSLFERFMARVILVTALVVTVTAVWRMVTAVSCSLARLHRTAHLLLLIVASLGFIVSVLVGYKENQTRPTFLVLLTEFSEGAGHKIPEDRSIFKVTADSIEQRVHEIDQTATVQRLNETVIDEQRALQLGRNARADVVGWGWYTTPVPPQTERRWHIEFRPVRPRTGYVHLTALPQTRPISELTGYSFESRIAAQADFVAFFLMGLDSYWSNNCDDAAKRFDAAVSEASNSGQDAPPGELLYFLGNAYFCIAQYDKAITNYDKAISAQPEFSVAYYNRGLASYRKGDPDKAIADYDKAISLQPDFASAYNNRGIAWSDKGDQDRAIADYDKTIVLGRSDAWTYSNRGLAWARKLDLDRAITDYDKAISLEPGYAAAYFNRGNAWSNRGDQDKAIADFNRGMILAPGDARSYNDRGIAWDRKGDLDKAIADYDKAIALQPESTFAYNNRGLAWSRKGNLDKAIADYDTAISLDPRYAGAHFNRGNAWYLKGDLNRATADFDRAITLEPESALASYARAHIDAIRDQVDTAVAWLRQAIRLDPKYRDMARVDPTFASLLSNRDFRSLVGLSP